MTMFQLIFVAFIATVQIISAQNCNGPPPFHINPQTCCNHPKVVEDQIFMRCFADFRGGLQKRQAGYHQGPPQSPQNCIGECVFRTVKVLRDDGEIDLQSSQKFFTTGLSSTPEWIPIVTQGFAKCTTEAKTMASVIRNNQGDCSPIPALTLACLHTHVITNCPANLWNDSAQCNELKSYFTNCPLPQKH